MLSDKDLRNINEALEAIMLELPVREDNTLLGVTLNSVSVLINISKQLNKVIEQNECTNNYLWGIEQYNYKGL